MHLCCHVTNTINCHKWAMEKLKMFFFHRFFAIIFFTHASQMNVKLLYCLSTIVQMPAVFVPYKFRVWFVCQTNICVCVSFCCRGSVPILEFRKVFIASHTQQWHKFEFCLITQQMWKLMCFKFTFYCWHAENLANPAQTALIAHL